MASLRDDVRRVLVRPVISEKSFQLVQAHNQYTFRVLDGAHKTEIRQAVAGEFTDADGVDAARAALARLFKGFVVHPPAGAIMAAARSGEALLVGQPGAEEFALEPQLRESVLAGLDDKGFPVLRREPLAQAENNHLSSWKMK